MRISRSASLGGPERRAPGLGERGPPGHGRLGPGPARGRAHRCSTRTAAEADALSSATRATSSGDLLSDHAIRRPASGRAARTGPGASGREPPEGGQRVLAAADPDPRAPARLRGPRRARRRIRGRRRSGPKPWPPSSAPWPLCPSQEPQALLQLGDRFRRHAATRRRAAAAYDRLDREYPASAQAQRRRAPPRAPWPRSCRPRPPEARRERRPPEGAGASRRRRRTRPRRRRFSAALERVPRATTPTSRASAWAAPSSPWAATRGRGGSVRSAAPRRTRPRPPTCWPDQARATRQPGRVRGGGRAIPRDALGRRSPARPRQQLPEGRARRRGAALLPAAAAGPYPSGKHAERAAWRVGWADYRAGRYEEAADAPRGSGTARAHPAAPPPASSTGRAARARLSGRWNRARAALRRDGAALQARLPRPARAGGPGRGCPRGPRRRLAAAPARGGRAHRRPRAAAHAHPPAAAHRPARRGAATSCAPFPSPTVGQATIAWIEWRRGQLRPAIIAMKRAYPEYIGEAGDRLPDGGLADPLPHRLRGRPRGQGHRGERSIPRWWPPSICQESTFDAGAVSRAGARGLMQIMPARAASSPATWASRYRRAALHDPVTSLDFGTRYLRQMPDRFDGRVERALAAYNAGPHRVDAWTALRPDIPPRSSWRASPSPRPATT